MGAEQYYILLVYLCYSEIRSLEKRCLVLSRLDPHSEVFSSILFCNLLNTATGAMRFAQLLFDRIPTLIRGPQNNARPVVLDRTILKCLS